MTEKRHLENASQRIGYYLDEYLKAGGTPNRRVGKFQSPLACAAAQGNIVVVLKLLNHDDIKVNTRNWDGLTALNYAVEGKHRDIIALLLNHGYINLNLGDDDDALSHADLHKDEQTVQMIIESRHTAILKNPRSVLVCKGKMFLTHTRIEVPRDMISRHMFRTACLDNSHEVIRKLLTWGFYTKENSKSFDYMTRLLLHEWKSFLPPWTRYAEECKYYPREFHDIAVQMLLVLKRYKVVKDIQHMILSYVARSWKF